MNVFLNVAIETREAVELSVTASENVNIPELMQLAALPSANATEGQKIVGDVNTDALPHLRSGTTYYQTGYDNLMRVRYVLRETSATSNTFSLTRAPFTNYRTYNQAGATPKMRLSNIQPSKLPV